MADDALTKQIDALAAPRDFAGWKALLEWFWNDVIPAYGDEAEKAILEKIKADPRASAKQVELLANILELSRFLKKGEKHFGPGSLAFGLNHDAFILQHPDGTEGNARLACEAAQEFARKDGILSLEPFYERLEMVGYPPAGIQDIRDWVEGTKRIPWDTGD